MKNILVIILLIACLPADAQRKTFPRLYATYTHPKLDSLLAEHQTIALLGEYAYLSRRVDEKSITEYDSIIQGGYRLALHLAAVFQQDERKKTVSLQPPDSTYNRLSAADIAPDETALYDRKVLCDILGVDAVITMRYLVFKKFYPAESHLINIASVAGTFGMAAQGFYVATFPIVAGTEVHYEYTTIHDRSGKLLYVENSINTSFPNMTPGRFKHRKQMRDFPYLTE